MAEGAVREILPIGSLVRLEGAEALVMVMGYEVDLGDECADYLGVPWPMGLVADDAVLAFDASAVAEVAWRGLWDEEADAGLAAVRRFRAATRHAEQSLRELIDTMTHEKFLELRERYTIDVADEEPEPDFLEEGDVESELGDEPDVAAEPGDDEDDPFELLGLEDEPEPEFLSDEEELA